MAAPAVCGGNRAPGGCARLGCHGPNRRVLLAAIFVVALTFAGISVAQDGILRQEAHVIRVNFGDTSEFDEDPGALQVDGGIQFALRHGLHLSRNDRAWHQCHLYRRAWRHLRVRGGPAGRHHPRLLGDPRHPRVAVRGGDRPRGRGHRRHRPPGACVVELGGPSETTRMNAVRALRTWLSDLVSAAALGADPGRGRLRPGYGRDALGSRPGGRDSQPAGGLPLDGHHPGGLQRAGGAGMGGVRQRTAAPGAHAHRAVRAGPGARYTARGTRDEGRDRAAGMEPQSIPCPVAGGPGRLRGARHDHRPRKPGDRLRSSGRDHVPRARSCSGLRLGPAARVAARDPGGSASWP